MPLDGAHHRCRQGGPYLCPHCAAVIAAVDQQSLAMLLHLERQLRQMKPPQSKARDTFAIFSADMVRCVWHGAPLHAHALGVCVHA